MQCWHACPGKADMARACVMQVACHDAAALRQLLFSCIRRRLIVAQGLSSPPGKAAKDQPAKRKSVGEKTPQKVCPRHRGSPCDSLWCLTCWLDTCDAAFPNCTG